MQSGHPKHWQYPAARQERQQPQQQQQQQQHYYYYPAPVTAAAAQQQQPQFYRHPGLQYQQQSAPPHLNIFAAAAAAAAAVVWSQQQQHHPHHHYHPHYLEAHERHRQQQQYLVPPQQQFIPSYTTTPAPPPPPPASSPTSTDILQSVIRLCDLPTEPQATSPQVEDDFQEFAERATIAAQCSNSPEWVFEDNWESLATMQPTAAATEQQQQTRENGEEAVAALPPPKQTAEEAKATEKELSHREEAVAIAAGIRRQQPKLSIAKQTVLNAAPLSTFENELSREDKRMQKDLCAIWSQEEEKKAKDASSSSCRDIVSQVIDDYEKEKEAPPAPPPAPAPTDDAAVAKTTTTKKKIVKKKIIRKATAPGDMASETPAPVVKKKVLRKKVAVMKKAAEPVKKRTVVLRKKKVVVKRNAAVAPKKNGAAAEEPPAKPPPDVVEKPPEKEEEEVLEQTDELENELIEAAQESEKQQQQTLPPEKDEKEPEPPPPAPSEDEEMPVVKPPPPPAAAKPKPKPKRKRGRRGGKRSSSAAIIVALSQNDDRRKPPTDEAMADYRQNMTYIDPNRDSDTFLREYKAFMRNIPVEYRTRADTLFKKFILHHVVDPDTGVLPDEPAVDSLNHHIVSKTVIPALKQLLQVVPDAAGDVPKMMKAALVERAQPTVQGTLAHIAIVQGIFEQSDEYVTLSLFDRLVLAYLRMVAKVHGLHTKDDIQRAANQQFAQFFGTNDLLDHRVRRKHEHKVKEREKRQTKKTAAAAAEKIETKQEEAATNNESKEESTEEEGVVAAFVGNKKERKRLKWFNKQREKKKQKVAEQRRASCKQLAAKMKQTRENRAREMEEWAQQRRKNDPSYVTADKAIFAGCFDPDSGNVVCLLPPKKYVSRKVERARLGHCANPNAPSDHHYVYTLNGRFEFTFAAIKTVLNGLFNRIKGWLAPVMALMPDKGYAKTFQELYSRMCVRAAECRGYVDLVWEWIFPTVDDCMKRFASPNEEAAGAAASSLPPQAADEATKNKRRKKRSNGGKNVAADHHHQDAAKKKKRAKNDEVLQSMTKKQVAYVFSAALTFRSSYEDYCTKKSAVMLHINRDHWTAVCSRFADVLKRVEASANVDNTFIYYLCKRIVWGSATPEDGDTLGNVILGGHTDAYTLPSPVGGVESSVYEHPDVSETAMHRLFREMFPHQHLIDSVTELNPDMFSTIMDPSVNLSESSRKLIAHGVVHFWVSIVAYYMSFRAMYSNRLLPPPPPPQEEAMEEELVVVQKKERVMTTRNRKKDEERKQSEINSAIATLAKHDVIVPQKTPRKRKSSVNSSSTTEDSSSVVALGSPADQRTCVIVFWCGSEGGASAVLLDRLYHALSIVLRLHAGHGDVNQRFKMPFASNVFLYDVYEVASSRINLLDTMSTKMEYNTLHLVFCHSKDANRPPTVVLPEVNSKQRTPGKRSVSFIRVSAPHKVGEDTGKMMFVDDKKDRTRKISHDAREEYYISKEAAAHPIGVIVDKGKNSVATHQFTDYICPLAILNMIRRRCGDMIASDSLRMEMLWQNYFVTSSGDVGEDTITMTTLGRNILRITRFFDGHTSDKVGVYMRAHKNAISATVAALGAAVEQHSEEKQDIEEMQCCSSANEEEDDEVVLKKHCRKRRQKKSTRNAFIPGLDCEEDDEVEVEEDTPPQKKTKKMSEEVNQKNDFPNKRRCTSEKICEKEDSSDSTPVETTTEEEAAAAAPAEEAAAAASSSSSSSESEVEEEEGKKMERVESDRAVPKEIVGEYVISDYAPPLNEEQRKKKQQQQNKANMDNCDEVPPAETKDDSTPEATS